MSDESGAERLPASSEAEVPWRDFRIERDAQGSLVEKIVVGISALVADGRLRIGSRMPSIRQFAKWYAISTFTVVEAYERLSSAGLLSSRRGSGYFVARKEVRVAQGELRLPALAAMQPLVTELYSGATEFLPVGASWLPPEWHGESLVMDAVRQAMRMPSGRLRGYGHPQGFPALRHQIANSLSEGLFEVTPDQMLLTHGSVHAFDLILRALTQPGDTVLIEDPGYANLPAVIRQHHCVPVGIPRGAAGLDLGRLQECIATYRPKLMLVATVLQNPLGTSLSHAQAHQLLRMATDSDMILIEGDTYRELASSADPSLAAMDGLQRVIRVGSFSKTLSPTVRVGSIAAPKALMPALVRAKMLSGLTTSEINERAVYQAITTSSYRRMIERLKAQLRAACDQTVHMLAEVGLSPIAQPRGGMFVSAGWQSAPTPEFNASKVADLALKSGILLSPDSFFSLSSSKSVWFRFNVGYTGSPQLADFFRAQQPQLGYAA
ncbi:aminotransferase-like domain-containing protein [Variovorax boronicumulans]|jgi:DNA-binding transcriptional MocR family regulator|uniref:aminotransferase-like domain-containing protein n=1 Tax=Variovorax boronicumulans TaxID=436515 RepID=UPI001C57AA28